MENKRVFILGAGASIGHSNGKFPGINNFFKIAKNLGITSSESRRDVNEAFIELQDYVKNNFGYSIIDSSKNIDIEELLTNIEVDLRRKNNTNLAVIDRAIKELIRRVLIQESHFVGIEEGEYVEFDKVLDVQDTIITFNWDLLLDNIFKEQFVEMYHARRIKESLKPISQYSDFISTYAARKRSTFEMMANVENPSVTPLYEPYTDKTKTRSLYLKLHGSIDWYVCNNNSCRSRGILFVADDLNCTYFCPECHEEMDNALIPPVLNKPLYDVSIIKRIWNLATRLIGSANEIIIWGYSLPESDFQSKWLLRQGRNSNLKKIILINPDVVNVARNKNARSINVKRGFVDRFANIYRGIVDNSNIDLYESMQDYIDGVKIYDKYTNLKIKR